MTLSLRISTLLGILVFAGCATVEPLDVRVVDIRPVEGAQSPLEQRFTVGLRIVNPNDRDFAATGLSLELAVNGQRLASGVSSTPFSVPRLGETVTSIEVGTTLFDVARQILTVSSGRPDMTYGIEGRVHMGGMRPSVPFEKTGTLPGYSPPK